MQYSAFSKLAVITLLQAKAVVSSNTYKFGAEDHTSPFYNSMQVYVDHEDGTNLCSFNTQDHDQFSGTMNCVGGYNASFTTGGNPRQVDLTFHDALCGLDTYVVFPATEESCFGCCGGNVPCTCCDDTYQGDFTVGC